MSDFTFNIAKGRVVELYHRVKNNDPANSAFLLVPISAGAVTDASLQDCDTLAAVLALAVTERTTGGWSRKTLTNTELAAIPSPDDTNNRFDIDLPDQSYTPTSGAVTDMLLCYDPDTTGGTDATVVPLVCYDYAHTPTGAGVLVVFDAAGAFRAA